ncbi:ABC transporter ATP-binding protein [Inquilinus limosus]|uniref:Peptide ABC transporter ATP-binding protein n=1 Tax=Inquilinus limosus TaxID=171674 RepID=A0A211ZTB2_9PROT|nr:ABC transporter ATP-binding protein [Inquilinus limosus]OWJ68510.1 peptide ABC transporter ATP-binding protein [Inquilinus limosus]
MPEALPLLAIDGLRVAIGGRSVVDGVSLSIGRGEVLALVGESGCGKSLTALSVLRLLPAAARIAGGTVAMDDTDLLALDEATLRDLRGNRVSVIFQEPVASLNPLVRVGDQVAESLRLHRGASAAEARREAVAMLARVGIADPERRAAQFPFELSGGMCQRVMIASALICRPEILIADEPTTALDVTIQAQILDLLKTLRAEAGSAILLITHDMGVVADMADRVAVMYGGTVVESGPVDALFDAPAHPYTKLLLATVPRLDGPRREELKTIAGAVPDAASWPQGCRFRTRCPLADERCAETPPLEPARHAGMNGKAGASPSPEIADAISTSPRGRGEEALSPGEREGPGAQRREGEGEQASPSRTNPATDHLAACWHSNRVGELA